MKKACDADIEVIRDEIVAPLASTIFLGRFGVERDKGWEISFSDVSSSEFKRLTDIATTYLSDAKSRIGQGSIHWVDLTDRQARGFALILASVFESAVVS